MKAYRRQPIRIVRGIPMFCEPNEYTARYERIATDHIRYLMEHNREPWVDAGAQRQWDHATAGLIIKHARKWQRILDVGVGMGRILARFDELDCYGVDVSFAYLRRGAKVGIRPAFAMAEDLPYSDGLFDMVVCADVLEHVTNLDAVLRSIRRVLRPGGTAILRVPVDEHPGPDGEYGPIHLRSFSESEIISAAAQIGNVCEVQLVPYGVPHEINVVGVRT